MSMHILEAEARKLAEHDAQLYGQGFYRKRGNGLAEHIPTSVVCVVTAGQPQAAQQQAEPVGDEHDAKPLQDLLYAYEAALQEEDETEVAPARQALIDYLKPILAAQFGQRAGVAEDARDAARYRFIRSTTKAVRDDDGDGRVEVTPEGFDATVDAAMLAAAATQQQERSE